MILRYRLNVQILLPWEMKPWFNGSLKSCPFGKESTMKFGLLTLGLMLSHQAFSMNEGSIVGIDVSDAASAFQGDSDCELQDLLVGKYTGTGTDRSFRNLEISSWASMPLMTTEIGSWGGYHHPLKLTLKKNCHSSHPNWRVDTQMIVRYDNGLSCRYPLQILAYPQGDKLFIEGSVQKTLCISNCTNCAPLDLTDFQDDAYRLITP